MKHLGLTDDERISELDVQSKWLAEQMKADGLEKSEVSKLANAISQTHHMRTAIEHLKLQRKKVADEAERKNKLHNMSDEDVDALVKEWLSARKK